MKNDSLMKFESIAECSLWSILQYMYFWPALRDNWSLKTIFWSFMRVTILQRFYCKCSIMINEFDVFFLILIFDISHFTLSPQVTTFVVGLSHLLILLDSQYCKQYEPRSDCFQGVAVWSGFIVFTSSEVNLNLYLLVSSADNFCKQFGPRSGPTKCPAWSGSNLFHTQMVVPKEFFEKVDFEKKQQMRKRHEKFPRGKELIYMQQIVCLLG